MAGKYSRNKGHNFERKICKLIREATGFMVQRNLVQTQQGGCDVTIDERPFVSIETKKSCTLKLPQWWRQTVKQATLEQIPILITQLDRRPIQVYFPICELDSSYPVDYSKDGLAILTLEQLIHKLKGMHPSDSISRRVYLEN